MNHILSDRFSLTITYQHRGYNRKDFLNLYFHDFCKLGTRFSVDEKFVTGDIEDFLIKEENNYLRYFGIREPRWKVSIAKTGDQISRAYIDSTEEYHKYISSWRLQRSKFKEWLKDKYPESDAELLFKDTTGKLLKLADEFSKH